MSSETLTTGVQFLDIDGKRSSQRAAKTVFADAVRGVDDDLAARVTKTAEWRKAYLGPVREVVETGARSASNASAIATAGLASLRRNLVFRREETDVTLDEAFSSTEDERFRSVSVAGEGERDKRLVVPYAGSMLEDDALLRQLDRWEERKVMEASCAEALRSVVHNPDWLDASDLTFAILGASSEMGPTAPLSRWGAHVIAVDLPRPPLWDRILKLARAGAGRFSIPLPKDRSSDDMTSAGMDLLVHAPETARWLSSFDSQLTIGNYVYADGANFVRLAAAADALIARMLEMRSDHSIAYLATPTDVFAVPEDIALDARTRARKGRALRTISGGRLYAANYAETVGGEGGRQWGISDALVPIQGPNYALAKALQRWRAIETLGAGARTSANVAPASRTVSVTKNRLLAAAYRGAPSFGVEIFDPATTRVVMAALLIYDLRNPGAVAGPAGAPDHPFDLFVEGALHGGIWRLPYEARSILPLGLLTGLVKRS